MKAHLKPNNEKRTRGSHAFKFLVPSRAKKDIFKFSLFPRTINEWSCLPEDTVNSKTVDSFKSKVDLFFFFSFYFSICLGVFIEDFIVGVISHNFYRLN